MFAKAFAVTNDRTFPSLRILAADKRSVHVRKGLQFGKEIEIGADVMKKYTPEGAASLQAAKKGADDLSLIDRLAKVHGAIWKRFIVLPFQNSTLYVLFEPRIEARPDPEAPEKIISRSWEEKEREVLQTLIGFFQELLGKGPFRYVEKVQVVHDDSFGACCGHPTLCPGCGEGPPQRDNFDVWGRELPKKEGSAGGVVTNATLPKGQREWGLPLDDE